MTDAYTFAAAGNATTGIGSLASTLPVIGVLIAAAVVLAIVFGIVFAIPFIGNRLRKILGFFGAVVVYFFKGVGICGVAAAIYFAGQWASVSASDDPAAFYETLKWLAVAIAGFFGIAGVGFVGQRVWNKAKSMVKRRKVR